MQWTLLASRVHCIWLFRFLFKPSLIGDLGELVAYFPEFWIEGIFECTLEHLHRRATGTNGARTDHALGQFEMLGAKYLEDFVIVGETLGKGLQEGVAVGVHVYLG